MKHTALLAALLVIASGTTALAPATPETPTPSNFLPAAQEIAGQEEKECHDDDQSGGMGGQEVSCDFSCDAAMLIEIYVDADDKSATVSGTAECADGLAHCSDTDYCGAKDTAPTTYASEGECSADSDEWFDNGLFVECSGNLTKPMDNTGGTTVEQWCPVTIEPHPPYPALCVRGPPPSFCRDLQATPQDMCEHTVTMCEGGNDMWDEGALPFQNVGCIPAGPWANLLGMVAHKAQDTYTLAYHVADGVVKGLECEALQCVPFREVLQ